MSRWFFYDLRRRHRRDGEVVLEPGSRVAHRIRNRTPAAVEDQVVRLRKELIDAGLDAGPATIWDHLSDGGGRVPSEATIWRILRRRGLVVPDPSKAPKRATRRFVAERANERWQIDSTHWALADGTGVEIINVIDDCTRVLVQSMAVRTCTSAGAFEAITRGAQRWGWPEGVLSDNGSAFHGRPGDDRPGGLSVALEALGIRAGRSRPYHPQTCGKVERFHRTLKLHLDSRDPAQTLEELQQQLDQFSETYNHQRRHRGIGRRTPASVFEITPKSGPADQPLNAVTRVYRYNTSGGSVWAGRHCRISIGNRYDGQPATIVLTGTRAHVFVHGQLVRHLTIDPTRQNQPLRSQL
ncbi:MAG TPA: integrase core domain-containing protein [Propionicimonas sp.]|nr:integrase core domain-containing protein [Propionicimonas sp.]